LHLNTVSCVSVTLEILWMLQSAILKLSHIYHNLIAAFTDII
jgi:hypothetical protein